VLNRNIWSGRWLSRRLFRLLVDTFVSDNEPVAIGLDDTIERRWGARVKARGIYRDPVRSSHGHFVKASGLRWLSLMPLPAIPWAKLAKVSSANPMECQMRAGVARHSRS
jgi:DDE superfamily endonuclease